MNHSFLPFPPLLPADSSLVISEGGGSPENVVAALTIGGNPSLETTDSSWPLDKSSRDGALSSISDLLRISP